MSSNQVMVRLEAAVRALGDADLSGMSDDDLRDQLVELSVALCEVDAQLARLAEGVRARGYAIVEEALRDQAAEPAAATAEQVTGGDRPAVLDGEPLATV